MKRIILASTSPRRKKLIQKLELPFEIVSPDYNEKMLNKNFSYDLVKSIAEKKADSVLNKIKFPAIIISADTVVVYNEKVLGKPADYASACRMLLTLKGNTHKVVTAVCVIDNEINKKIINTETSEVTFNEISNSQIITYIDKYKPYDKAGAYGIQELPKGFIKEIKGSYDNIVGLPVKILKEMITEITNKEI